jgi:peptide deformylase
MYRRTITWPNPNLEVKAIELKPNDADGSIVDLATDLEDSLRVEGGPSISAPQIGFGVRAFAVNCSSLGQANPDSSELMKDQSTWFAYNPIVVATEGTAESTETCASLPYQSAQVRRHRTVTLQYRNLAGDEKTQMFEPPLSIVIQHEIDHLDGVLYISRISKLKSGMIKRSINKRQQELKKFKDSMKSMDTPKSNRVSKTVHLSKDEIRRRRKMRAKSRS